jgi:hypothetical protein
MAIRPNDRRRLARLAMPLVSARRDEVNHRVELRQSVDFLEYVEALLLLEGIDPERTCVKGHLHEADATLAAIPDTPELQRADDEYLARADTGWVDAEWDKGRHYRPPVREEESSKTEIERLMGRYRTDCRDIDVATASVFDLLAWCLARHGATVAEAQDDIDEAAKDLELLLDRLPDDPTEEDI